MPTIRDVLIDVGLSDLSVAYRQERPPISDLVFPRVPVSTPTGKFYVWSQADHWRDEARKRAPGDKFARIDMNVTTDTFSVEEYGIEEPVADEVNAAADRILNLKQAATRNVTSKIILKKDVAWAADFMKTGVWTTDVTGTTNFVKWNDATSDPSGDVQTGVLTISDALGDTEGMRFVAVTGTLIENRLKNHPDAIERIKYTQSATPAAVRQMLAMWLGIDELIVVRRRKTTSAEGAATATYANVIDDDFLIVAVPENPGEDTPAAGYTFTWDEGGRGDQYVEEYRDETIKSDIIRGVTHFDQKLVAAPLGYFLADAAD
jgi:hypothetical protein